jgi:hypothetical protein
MFVQIETKDRDLAYEIMGKEIKNGVSLSSGESIELENMSVAYRSSIVRKAEEIPVIINLVITLGTGVVASYAGSWLYNKIHGKAKKLFVDYKEIEINEGEITKIVEMKIKNK